MKTAITLLATALVASACGSEPTTEPTQGAPSASEAELDSVDSGESPAGPAAADETSSPWVLRNPVVDPTATALDILVSDQSGCTSGQRADDRIRYEITHDETEVVITALTTALDGDQECPSNPFTPLVVTLSEPIGQRKLIDGSGKVVDQYEDYSVPPGPLFRLSTEAPLPPVAPASTLTTEEMFYIEARCEVSEDSFEDRFATGWSPDGVFATPEAVIASAVAGYGLSQDGWHLVESTDGFGQVTKSWTQYLDGVPKASLLVMPGLLGWGAFGVVCDLGGPWTPDAEPPADREAAPLDAPASDLADVYPVLEEIPSLSSDGEFWTFANADQRCATWIEIENALERTDHVIQSRWIVEFDGQRETWQIRMSVVNSDGELALLTTAGTDQVSIHALPLPQLSEPQGLPWESGLGPCWLDTPIPADRE